MQPPRGPIDASLLFSRANTIKPDVVSQARRYAGRFRTWADQQGEWEIMEDMLFLYPSPGEIIDGFFDADLEYRNGLVNSVEKKDSYLGSRSQALNLGIYITDLAYLAKYGLTGEALRHR